MIRGPITGGSHGWAFRALPLFDLAAHGYEEAEYFLSGEATTYRRDPRTEWGRDGRWTAEAAGRAPFTTRMLVYRPADPERFNHTAIVSWNNVTAGYELFQGESPEILQGGYAFVAASVQRVGVHGFSGANQGLAAWDPERYGSLSLPTDDASYDIFTQVARAVGPNRACATASTRWPGSTCARSSALAPLSPPAGSRPTSMPSIRWSTPTKASCCRSTLGVGHRWKSGRPRSTST